MMQVIWVHPMDVNGSHWEASNRGLASKGEHFFTTPDTGGTPLMKGFRVRCVDKPEGTREDSHYVQEAAVDLGGNRVSFNDGNADDFFDYDISCLALL